MRARTQVAIVGAGPAGLVLSLLLQRAGIESEVLEARSRDYVERRVRAGLLEQNTVDLLHEIGCGERLDREGLRHAGIYVRRSGRTHYRPDARADRARGDDLRPAGGGQGPDRRAAGARRRRCASRSPTSRCTTSTTDRPRVTYVHDGAEHELECDFVAGCDGFHGVCRPAVPDGVLAVHEFTYPFAWLGILAEAPPATEELIYAWHEHGFALYSMRSPEVSRLYLQVPADEELDRWPDERIWEELQLRMASDDGFRVNEGPIFDKGITPMRSFVTEPMQHGRLFLAGDAAHIVPPTGAKGLNLAVNDVRLLAAALAERYAHGRDASGSTPTRRPRCGASGARRTSRTT